jgi:hypothetical protein
MLELPFSLLPLQVSEIIFTSVTLKVFSPEDPLEVWDMLPPLAHVPFTSTS